MSKPTHPSQALTQIASALHALERVDDKNGDVAEWLERATAFLEQKKELEDPVVQEWTLESPELLSLSEILAVPTWPPETPGSPEEFLCLAEALQRLDSWHSPLTVQSDGTVYPRLKSHREDVGGEFLGRDDHGMIVRAAAIPRGGPARLERPEHPLLVDDPLSGGLGWEKRPILLRHLLVHTVYLPADLEVEDADAARTFSGRRVRLRYLRQRTAALFPAAEDGAPIVVGIAPIPQRRDDARLDLSPCNTRYGVRPIYGADRIDEILKLANEQQITLLLFPEMSIPEELLSNLPASILRAGRASAGALPTLRYVFAGVWGERAVGGCCRNFMVAFDAFGKEIFRQDKLHHWNLNEGQLKRYGFAREFPHLAPTLREDIEPAKEVVVADLEGLGRVMTLICADIAFNTPGDWLISHLNVDWLQMPIMDHSTVLRDDWGGPWISSRAQRAARAGHGRVMVTNSVALTHRINDENVRAGEEHRCFTECGIGLLIDATTEDPTYAHISIPMAETEGPAIVRSVEWKHGWHKLPQAAPKSGS